MLEAPAEDVGSDERGTSKARLGPDAEPGRGRQARCSSSETATAYSRHRSAPAETRSSRLGAAASHAPRRTRLRRIWDAARGWSGWRFVTVDCRSCVRWRIAAWRAARRSRGRPHIRRAADPAHRRWGAVRSVRFAGAQFAPSLPTTCRGARFCATTRPSNWAADLFTVQTLTFRTLYVFVVIDVHGRRRCTGTSRSTRSVDLEADDRGDRLGSAATIRDRDRSYGGDFIARARRIGIETILTPVRALANAIAERRDRDAPAECLDHDRRLAASEAGAW